LRIDMNATYTAMRRLLKAYSADESGATAIEYALIAALIGIGLIGGLKLLGGGTNGMWTKIGTSVSNAIN